MFHDAIFNTFRRSKGQIFYWLPPLVAGYYLMDWATERFVTTRKWSILKRF
jgi:ubiquinol-cytochrome c reductase subunit 8